MFRGDLRSATPRPGPKKMAPATHKVGSAPAIRARHMAAPWWCLRRRLGLGEMWVTLKGWFLWLKYMGNACAIKLSCYLMGKAHENGILMGNKALSPVEVKAQTGPLTYEQGVVSVSGAPLTCPQMSAIEFDYTLSQGYVPSEDETATVSANQRCEENLIGVPAVLGTLTGRLTANSPLRYDANTNCQIDEAEFGQAVRSSDSKSPTHPPTH